MRPSVLNGVVTSRYRLIMQTIAVLYPAFSSSAIFEAHEAGQTMNAVVIPRPEKEASAA